MKPYFRHFDPPDPLYDPLLTPYNNPKNRNFVFGSTIGIWGIIRKLIGTKVEWNQVLGLWPILVPSIGPPYYYCRYKIRYEIEVKAKIGPKWYISVNLYSCGGGFWLNILSVAVLNSSYFISGGCQNWPKIAILQVFSSSTKLYITNL